MDKRTLIILTGLLLPIIVLALLAQSEPPKPQPVPQQASAAPAETLNLPPAQTLEEARRRARVILDTLNRMTPEEWEEQQLRRGVKPDTAPQQPPVEAKTPSLDEPREMPDAQDEDDKH